ncbi:MAG: protein kinase [Oscillospiraceae bacterium]|nr:protein kinase [Oscillospiraceae bacterium]
MSEKILCPHCLSPIEEQKSACPFCGKSLENCNPTGALPFGYLLAGRYTIGRVMQVDGEGILYSAVANQSGFRVEIKEYLPVTLSSGRDGALCVQPKPGSEVLFKTTHMDFADLYRALQRITPATGLVAVLDVLEANGTAYAVLEVTQGVPLERYLALRGGPLPPEEARSLMQPVMEGVAALHKIGLVHRGVAPDNIRITEGGLARLSGYATLGLRTLGSELKAQLYEGYTAPEQYFAEQFEGRYTDVYSVAAVFYRLVTGQAPVPAIQRKVMDSQPTARQVERTVPGYVSAVLSQAMRLDPSERVQNIPELMGALASQNAASALMDRGEEPKPESGRRWIGGALVAALVAVCILALLLAWILLGRSGPGEQASSESEPPVETAAPEEEILYVPYFVGMTYSQVMYSEEYQETYLFTITSRYDSNSSEGVILEQHPMEGSALRPGEVIELVVSKGPELVPMPYIIGFTRENAEEELNRLGIQFSLLMLSNNGEYVSGCVVKTDPVYDPENPALIDVQKTIVNVYIAADRVISESGSDE